MDFGQSEQACLAQMLHDWPKSSKIVRPGELVAAGASQQFVWIPSDRSQDVLPPAHFAEITRLRLPLFTAILTSIRQPGLNSHKL